MLYVSMLYVSSICMYVCMNAWKYVCVLVCMYVYVCIYVCMARLTALCSLIVSCNIEREVLIGRCKEREGLIHIIIYKKGV
jgi:hypothetical protein